MKIKMKINYNSFVDLVLGRYMEEIEEQTIETEDPLLVEWCKNQLIIKEAEEGK